MVYAQRDPIGKDWVVMLLVVAPLPLVNLLFKLYCKRAFDRRCAYYAKATAAAADRFAHDNPTLGGGGGDDASSRRSGSVAVRFGHPAMHKPLMTPMVHARAQHLLSKIYTGRMNDDDDVDYESDEDAASFGASEQADAYSMHSMGKKGRNGSGLKLFGRGGGGGRGEKAPKQKKKKGLFQFVSDAQLDRAEFPAPRAGQDADGGPQFDMAEDALGPSRTGTPAPRHVVLPHQRSGSLPRGGTPLQQQQGVTDFLKPLQQPGDEGLGRGGSATDVRLVGGAAPMGSRATTPRSTESGWL
jgi:hypothetical protein